MAAWGLSQAHQGADLGVLSTSSTLAPVPGCGDEQGMAQGAVGEALLVQSKRSLDLSCLSQLPPCSGAMALPHHDPSGCPVPLLCCCLISSSLASSTICQAVLAPALAPPALAASECGHPLGQALGWVGARLWAGQVASARLEPSLPVAALWVQGEGVGAAGVGMGRCHFALALSWAVRMTFHLQLGTVPEPILGGQRSQLPALTLLQRC